MSSPAAPLRLPAPAKLNLLLHVVGRRPDGYHLLQTIFRFLDFRDEVTLAARADGRIRRTTGAAGVPEEQDLIIRAARLLQQEAGCALGADVGVEKRIPMGGGLGGGSSDAATVLIGLNRLWNLGLSRAQLQVLGARLGADVPIFIHGRSAFAEGIGEIFHPIDIAPAWYLVLTPPVHVPTARIFADPKLTRQGNPLKMRAFFAGQGRNDLEPVVREHYREVDEHLRWLSRFGHSTMSGSGACVFSAFDTEKEAQAVLAQLPEHMSGFVARGIDTHPLHDWLNHVS